MDYISLIISVLALIASIAGLVRIIMSEIHGRKYQREIENSRLKSHDEMVLESKETDPLARPVNDYPKLMWILVLISLIMNTTLLLLYILVFLGE
jgi:hypothetical protein